jgi:hypothetical protein
MSEEIAQAAGDIAYWQERALNAEADAAALVLALRGRQTCKICGGRGITWTDINGEAEAEACECRIFADEALAHPRPGAALLAELDAARELKGWARKWQHHHIISLEMIRAMDAMDAAAKGAE